MAPYFHIDCVFVCSNFELFANKQKCAKHHTCDANCTWQCLYIDTWQQKLSIKLKFNGWECRLVVVGYKMHLQLYTDLSSCKCTQVVMLNAYAFMRQTLEHCTMHMAPRDCYCVCCVRYAYELWYAAHHIRYLSTLHIYICFKLNACTHRREIEE